MSGGYKRCEDIFTIEHAVAERGIVPPDATGPGIWGRSRGPPKYYTVPEGVPHGKCLTGDRAAIDTVNVIEKIATGVENVVKFFGQSHLMQFGGGYPRRKSRKSRKRRKSRKGRKRRKSRKSRKSRKRRKRRRSRNIQ